MAVMCTVYIYEEGVSDSNDYEYDYSHLSVTGDKTWSPNLDLITYNNKKCFLFTATSASGTVTISTTDAFEGTTAEIEFMGGDSYGAYVELQKKDLYAWNGYGYMIENDNWYTLSPTPTTTDYIFTENGFQINAYGKGNFTSDTPIIATDFSLNPPTITLEYSTTG